MEQNLSVTLKRLLGAKKKREKKKREVKQSIVFYL